MKKLTQFEKFGLMGAIIIACTFFYMKRVYEPQEKQFKKTVDNLNKVIGEVNNLRQVPSATAIKRELEKGRKELAELKSQLEDTLMHTGAQREVTKLLRDINDMVAGSGLQVVSLVPGQRTWDELLEWNQFQLELDGSFHGFLCFLRQLQEMRDAVKVENVELLKGTGQRLIIKFKLKI